MITVAAKTPLDIDGYACTFAYTEFLNKTGRAAVGAALGEPHREISFLNQELGISPLPWGTELLDRTEQIILVDTSSLVGLPENFEADKVIEVIDHREAPDAAKLFPNARIQIEKIGAAATLIAEKFRENNTPISREAAILLHSTIALHTHNFKTSNTSQRDKEAYRWLAEATDVPTNLIQRILKLKSEFDNESFRKAVVGDIKEGELGGKRLAIAQLEVTGLRRILAERKAQLLKILRELQEEHRYDYFFLTATDLIERTTTLVTKHEPTQQLLERGLNDGTRFDTEGFAERRGVLLRKELIPLLRKSVL